MKTLIVVPARYASQRLPGKPLALIAGRSMVSRVAGLARRAAAGLPQAEYVVATDDTRILEHCRDAGIPVVMTDPALPSGSDRALAAAEGLGAEPEFIVNLQGDAPFTPAAHVTAIVEALAASGTDAATPYICLSWDALDRLRAHKQETPFSGTTVVTDPNGPDADEHVAHYRALVGEHRDWDEYRASLVTEKRSFARLTPTYAYGMLKPG